MIPTNNVGAKDGAGGTQEVQKPDQIGRPIERTTRDDGRGKRFKEVLGKEDEKKEKAKLIASDDDEEESLSPMSLITSVTKKREKSGDDASTDSGETPPDEVAVVVTPSDSHDKGVPTKKLTPEKVVIPGDTKTATPLTTFVQPRTLVARGDEKEIVKQPNFETPIAVATTAHTTKPILTDDDKEVLITPAIPDKKTADDTGKQKGGDVLGQATLGVAVPVAQPIEASIVTDVKKVPQETAKVRETLVKLAEEMIARLSVVTTVDRTDTTITLRYPPLFAGAQVMITEYKSAQNQFNITFSGLHPEALQMIAMKNNQEELRQNLIDKGYMLQMVTIEQKIPGLESTKTETLFTALKQDERAENQGDATEEDK